MRLLAVIVIITIGASSVAQENKQQQIHQCDAPNPDLVMLFKYDTIQTLFVHTCIETSDTDADQAHSKKEFVDLNWYHFPNYVLDGNPNTAWIEHTDNKILLLPCLNLEKPIEIWTGLAATSELFAANSRPRRIKLGIVAAEIVSSSDHGTMYRNLTIIAEKSVTLEDQNSFQDLLIPEFKVEKYFHEQASERAKHAYLLAIKVVDNYDGTSSQMTSIAEVRNSPD